MRKISAYSLYDEILVENQRKEQIWKSKTFLRECPFKNNLLVEFIAYECEMRER